MNTRPLLSFLPFLRYGMVFGVMLHASGLLPVSCATLVRAEDTDPPPCLLRHPYLQKGSSRSMGIAWMIDDERPCAVEFGLTRKLGSIVESSHHQRRHFVEITDLQPDTRYYYRIRSGRTWLTPNDDAYYFRTHAEDPNRPFSFVVLGDSGDPDTRDQCPVADLLLALRPKPDFVIHTGDVTQRWALDEAEYDLLLFGVYRDILRNTPFYPTQGNHDWVTDWEHSLDPLYPRYFASGRLSSQLVERFDMPFWRVFHSPRDNEYGDVAPYSFRYGNTVLVCDGGSGLKASRVLAEKRFTEGKETWRFFYSHYFGLQGNAIPGADLAWDPPLPGCDMTFRGHIHVYSRSAPYGPDKTIDMLVGCSGSSIAESYYESMITPENPHGLRPGITDWNEKCPHLVQVLIDGPKMTLKSYYPDGLVFDKVTIDKSNGTKSVVGMAVEDHPVHPLWQRGLTPLMKQLWVDENPKWRSLGSGLWDYVDDTPLERFNGPVLRRSRYVDPNFVLRRRRIDSNPANLEEARKALQQLMSIHYRLGHHESDKANFHFFEHRFRHLFGAGDAQTKHLAALARDEQTPIKQRLGAIGGLGILAQDFDVARQQLVEFSNSDDFNILFSACVIRACWLGDQEALDQLFAWMKREAKRQPANPQFLVDAPGHYGNPMFVLRRFTFPTLFGLDSEQHWESKPTIEFWVDFYEKNKHRLRYVREEQRYILAPDTKVH